MKRKVTAEQLENLKRVSLLTEEEINWIVKNGGYPLNNKGNEWNIEKPKEGYVLRILVDVDKDGNVRYYCIYNVGNDYRREYGKTLMESINAYLEYAKRHIAEWQSDVAITESLVAKFKTAKKK